MPATPPPQAAVPLAAYPSEEPPPGERTGGRWWWWALAALVVAAVVVGALLLAGGGKKVTVPEVVGVDEPSARAALTRDGFDVESSRRSDDKPRGTVIGQDPSGGTKAKEGSTVMITVSDGPAAVRVPPVEGLTYASARNRLEKAGFKVRRRDAPSDTVERGRVVSSTPQEGTEADRGETVELVVSSGREKVTAPDVTGRNEDAARSALEDDGLKVTVRRQDSQNEDPGTVLTQDPKSGTEVDAGSSVTLTVAREPREVAVPDVTGEQAADAVARLSDEGFRIRQRQQDVDSPEGDGVVIEQDPAGGRAPRGSTVTITVGRFTGSTTQQQQTTPQNGTTPQGGNGNATPGAAPGATSGTTG